MIRNNNISQKEDFLIKDRIGIMPIGALSVAFVSYIQGVGTFIESGKTHYKIGDKLKIFLHNEIKEIVLTEENYTDNIMSLAINGRLPEIILFSPPNHRLISVLDEVIDMIGEILKLRNINCVESNIDKYIPKFVMLSNGIYYDDVMSYLTKNFENTDENIREQIKGNFVRATTHQTGTRMESDIGYVFKPGTKGGITITGGSKESRERVISLFKKYDYPVSEMEGEPVKRIEFDKAVINLSANAVQLSLLFGDDGKIRDLTMGDLVSDRKMRQLCKRIIYTTVSIGVKSGIYKKRKDISQKQFIDTICQEEWKKIEEKSKIDNVHIVSSIATVIERYERYNRQNIAEGKPLRLPPLEENIINYLLKLSKENNLDEEKVIIEELRDSILKTCGKVWC